MRSNDYTQALYCNSHDVMCHLALPSTNNDYNIFLVKWCVIGERYEHVFIMLFITRAVMSKVNNKNIAHKVGHIRNWTLSKSATELSTVDSPLQLSTGHFSCVQALLFTINRVFLRVGATTDLSTGLFSCRQACCGTEFQILFRIQFLVQI